MRHSNSQSNYIRAQGADPKNPLDPGVIASQAIRDPGLSWIGTRDAKGYGPVLRKRLAAHGFNVEGAIICASALKRAQDTARIVFGRRPVVLPHFTENGQVPENTPAGHAYAPPKWGPFIAHLSTIVNDGDSVAVVGHGSFLRSQWERLTGSPRSRRLENLEGILLDANVSAAGIRIYGFRCIYR